MRSVIITGASRGLGRDIALKFGNEGYAVCVNYVTSKDRAEAVAQEICDAGGTAFAFKADVRRISDVQAMVETTVSRFGRLDVLVNNAGIGTASLLSRLSDDLWQDVMDVNLKGCFNCTKAATVPLSAQPSSHIINISSISGVKGKSGHAAYAVSKAGMIGFTKASAIELAASGIRVNAVLPGYMLTDMGAGASYKARVEATADSLLKQYSDPVEVAAFIFHLAGMNGVSGQVFNLDSRIY